MNTQDKQKKDEEQVSRFIGEGNPNTQKTIKETKEEANTVPYTDEQLGAEIKAAIEKEDSVSELGKKVHVFVEKGTVTLKGKVYSEPEKMTIGDKATAFAGFSKVHNEIEIEQSN